MGWAKRTPHPPGSQALKIYVGSNRVKTPSPYLCSLIRFSNVKQVCDVIEKKSDKEEPCIFPFKYANTTYFACSTADNDDKPWCSTKGIVIIGCLKSFILTAKLKDGCLVNTRNNNPPKVCSKFATFFVPCCTVSNN